MFSFVTFFYVKQNIEFKGIIDVSIGHSSFFCDALFSEDPFHQSFNLFYLPYGVRQRLIDVKHRTQSPLRLVFLGRLEEAKGVKYLYDIETILEKQKILVEWTIIGQGNLKSQLLEQWALKSNIAFFEPDNMDETLNILSKQDIFVFPTLFEGTPVSILEALSVGVVTIVNDLPGGIRDLIGEDIGFRCKVNNVDEFANRIEKLHYNRDLLFRMKKNSLELSRMKYDITKNADSYFELFLRFEYLKRVSRVNFKTKLESIIDNKFFPSRLTKLIRNLR